MADMLQKSMMESADVPRRTSRPFMEILLEAKQEGPKFNKGRTFLIKVHKFLAIHASRLSLTDALIFVSIGIHC